jgi:cardiolipin synthase
MTSQVATHNKVELIRNGHEFIELNIKLIKNAKKSIFLHTYIFEDDEVTNYIIEELLFSAQRGITIYMIVDAVGSAQLSKQVIQKIINAGINFSIFKPIIKYKNIGRRLHQKILLVDMNYCVLGGINISKKYNSPEVGIPWLDYSCLFEGEEIRRLFEKIAPLYKKQFSSFDKSKFYSPLGLNNTLPLCFTKTIVNDWFKRKQEIYNSYIEAIDNSVEDIYILATYFLPGKKLLKSLKRARSRGVEVNLYFGTNTDQKLAAKASEYFYYWYLSVGINIFEWNKTIIHGKIALIDGTWVSIGSYNHNFLSRYGNSEINLEISDQNFASVVQNEFCNIQASSNKIEINDFKRRTDLQERIVLTLTYALLNILTFLSLLFIYKQDEIKK